MLFFSTSLMCSDQSLTVCPGNPLTSLGYLRPSSTLSSEDLQLCFTIPDHTTTWHHMEIVILAGCTISLLAFTMPLEVIIRVTIIRANMDEFYLMSCPYQDATRTARGPLKRPSKSVGQKRPAMCMCLFQHRQEADLCKTFCLIIHSHCIEEQIPPF